MTQVFSDVFTSNISQWDNDYGRATWQAVTYRTGAGALRHIASGSGQGFFINTSSQPSATPGTTYKATAWLNGAGNGVTASIRFYNSGGTQIGSDVPCAAITTSGTWQQIITPALVAPATTAKVGLVFLTNASGTWYLDDLSLDSISVPAVSNLYACWRASELALSDGAYVTSWTDLANSIAIAQGTQANQPYYRASVSGLLNKPAVEFASARWLYTATGVAGLLKDTNFTVCIAGRTGSSVSGEQYLFDVRYSGGVRMAYEMNVGNLDAWAASGTQMDGSASLSTSTAYAITLHSTKSTTTTQSKINGTYDAQSTDLRSAGTTADTTNITVGAYNNGQYSVGWTGHIAEILVYHAALDSNDLATVHTYFQSQYGMTVSDYNGALNTWFWTNTLTIG
jgi:hypothetical protein